jgi:uncharacterized membrane protein
VIRAACALLQHLCVLPFTIAAFVLDVLDEIAEDEDARADAALVLIVVLALVGWALGVFEE